MSLARSARANALDPPVGFLQGFEALVLKVCGATAAKEIDTKLRAQAAEIARRRKQGEDITIPALNPALAVICNEASVAVLVVLGVFAAGVAELRKPRARGEKIDRTPFGTDSEDFVARVFIIAYQMGLDYKRPPHRPKDSMAEVAVKVARRGQEGAAGVRHHHGKRLK